MLLPVAANRVIGREHPEEVRIELRGRGGSQSAGARQARFAFQVAPPVGSLVVIRREHLKQMVTNRVVLGLVFGEAA